MDADLFTAEGRYPVLREHRLLRGLDDDTVRRLASALPTHATAPGELLMREGDLTSHMFLVLAGEFEVLTRGGTQGPNVRVALLGPGDWLGEMALLDVLPRSATVRSLARGALLKLSRAEFQELIYQHDIVQGATLVTNIARELSRRLRIADGIIARADAGPEYVSGSRLTPQG